MNKSFIWDIPECDFKDVVINSSNYSEIARKLGHYGTGGAVIVKKKNSRFKY